MKKIILILSVILFTQFNTASAQQPAVVTHQPGWQKIAELVAGFKTDRDDLVVLGADKFQAIQIRVTDAHIHLEDLDVRYQFPGITEHLNENIDIRADFKPGERSRVIYLQYPCLKLEKVVFKYGTVPNYRAEKAHVELWGLK